MTTVTQLKPRLRDLEAGFERITPALATEMLEKNTMNRTLSQQVINSYAAEMKRGAWDEDNGETIKIADDGTILDGQHRLWGIVESGVTLRLLVVRGVDKNSFTTIDSGKKRTTGDVCSIAGIKDPNNAAAAAAVVWAYKRKKIVPNGPIRARDFLRSDLVKFCMEHAEALQASTRVARSNGCGKLCSGGVMIAMHYLFTHESKASSREEQADLFFTQLGGGVFDARVSPPESHPIRVLREKLIDNRSSLSKMPSGAMAALIIKAWNGYVAAKPSKLLRVKKDEAFPVIA